MSGLRVGGRILDLLQDGIHGFGTLNGGLANRSSVTFWRNRSLVAVGGLADADLEGPGWREWPVDPESSLHKERCTRGS